MSVRVVFEDHHLTVGNATWQLDRKIIDAAAVGNRVFVIFDYMAYPSGTPARNLVAFDMSGNQLWTAENPTSGPADAWVSLMNTDPLTVWNFACYRCKIAPETGQLIEAVFTK